MKKYLKSKFDSLTEDQKMLHNHMSLNNLLQINIPTGAGKGYLMMFDLLNQIISNKSKVSVISTHRLMLNTQHLNDIFEMLSPIIGNVGYVFVGSSKYDIDKFQENIDLNTALLNVKLSYNEIVSSTTNLDNVNTLVNEHLSKNRKVVILTTYHSLNKLKDLSIDTLYCDEAQTLASDEEGTKFQDNFNTINYKRCYFFTATPKDCVEDTESFLMNNFEVFGQRVGLNFKHCIDNGYIVRPVIHLPIPSDYNESYDYKSIENMSKLVTEAYWRHQQFIKDVSCSPELIDAKILVKCTSVDDMWKLHKSLVGTMPCVKICAGASRNDTSNFLHYIDNLGIVGRSEYLEELQKLDYTDKAIILHYDTMSEGINIAGFTGVMFLGGKLPTIIKSLQNTGRATRLHTIDRERFRKGEIKVGDGNWIKPSCSVIIPYYDRESEFTKNELSKQIKSLRDNFGYDPIFYVSIGSDLGSGKNKPDDDILNDIDEKKKKFAIIEEITHEIEILDQEEKDYIENNRLNGLTKLQLLKEKIKINI